MEEIIKRIKFFEGLRLKPYQCPAGKWTVGYGYNYQDRGFSTDIITKILKSGFTEQVADELVALDAARCVKEAEANFSFYRQLNPARQAVITDMVYQLGVAGIKKFKNMLSCLAKGDYADAAKEMTDSKWYVQSGRRSVINTLQMKTGVWQEVK